MHCVFLKTVGKLIYQYMYMEANPDRIWGILEMFCIFQILAVRLELHLLIYAKGVVSWGREEGKEWNVR